MPDMATIQSMAVGLDMKEMMEVMTKGMKLLKNKDATNIGKFLNSLSEHTFQKLAPILVTQIDLSQEKADGFKNSEEQVADFIKKYPRLEPFREVFLERVENFRREKNLTV